MIRYLFDTDILSHLMRRRFPELQARFAKLHDSEYAISAVTYAEVLAGLEALSASHPVRIRAQAFLESVSILDWPADAAVSYAEIKHRVRQQPLADLDMMIASHAIAIGASLVTNNTKHFGRIGEPLQIENWLW